MRTFNAEFEVYFEDISPAGKIHLEKIVEWMSVAREKYFKATCPEYLKFVESPVKMFTTNISVTVLDNAGWADKITAVLSAANIKKISFEMHIDFRNERTNKIIAKTMQKVAFVNMNTKDFAAVPKDMKGVIVNYIKEA